MTDSSITRGGATSEFRIGNVLSQAWTVFANNFVVFFVIMLIVSLPNLLVATPGTENVAANPSAFFWKLGVALLLAIILNTLGEAVIVYGAFQSLRGQEVRLGEALQKGLARFLPILGLGVLSGIAIMFGFLLLVVPGLFLLVMWSVALPVCVLEGLGPTTSLSRSSALTKGHRWQIFGIVLLVFIANGVVGFVLDKIFSSAGVMTTAKGRGLTVAIFVNDVPLPPDGDPIREGKVIGRLCEILYQNCP